MWRRWAVGKHGWYRTRERCVHFHRANRAAILGRREW
jgi:hypothetical protein